MPSGTITPLLRCTFLLAGAILSAQGAAPPRTELQLRAFYARACVACHGEDGSAVSLDGRRLKGRDFTSERDMRGSTDEDLAKTIRKGLLFGLSMPSFKGDLTEEEIQILVRNIIRKARKGEPIQPLIEAARPKRTPTEPSTGPR